MKDHQPDRRCLERVAAFLCERAPGQAIDDDLIRQVAELTPEQTVELYEQLLVHFELDEHLGEPPSFASEVMAKVGGHRERQAEVREAGEEAPAPQLALAEMFQSERQSKRILIGVMSLATAATLVVIALP